jgi:hypothetical protein
MPRSVGGGQSVFLHLPIPSGSATLCTQGAGQKPTHTGKSTYYDLDFDTSNTVREEVFAPVSGVAHVFYAIQTGSPFGTHIIIDLGNGTYVVVAHLDKVFVCDNCEVSVGELIGIEGCTGACTGDHVHIGLHEGDATLPAENGVSIEATYLIDGGTLSSAEFVCGTGAGQDDPIGQTYTSVLLVVNSHPNGTLVITDHNPKVYLLENGMRRWILNEQVFWSHGYDFSELVVISDEELNCYPEGEMIAQIGLVDAVTDPSGTMWLVVGATDSWNRFRVQVNNFGWQGVLASWGLSYTWNSLPPPVGLDHPYLTEWNVQSGNAEFRSGALVKEASSSAVYVTSKGVAMPIKNWATYLLLGFLNRTIVLVEDGVVSNVQTQVGNCSSGQDCLNIESVNVCGGGSPVQEGGQGGPMFPPPPQSNESSSQSPQSSDSSPPPRPQASPQSDVPVSAPVNSNSFCLDGQHACLADLDGNGITETLLLADFLWTTQMLVGTAAYVYGNGGCFDGTFTQGDLVTSVGGYYAVNFSHFAVDCSSELTLVSMNTLDGNPHAMDMSNWLWWQTGQFCWQGNTLCNLMDNGTSWEEWLLSVSWHPQIGLTTTGNGLISNLQL